MILIIDNYDSFTQNLVQYVGELNFTVEVRRNDNINIKDIAIMQPSHIIISPGPGHPKDASNIIKIIQQFAPDIPILGVCLGHQIIGYLYKYNIKKLSQPMHGKVSKVKHNNTDLFKKIPNPFTATRYHSLIITNNHKSDALEITAWTTDGTIMACKHKKYQKLQGIQFHPESLWTQYGKIIIHNFLLT
uniref:Anthranilate synthase component 2 n=1 Tax=Campylaephora sungminbooi TaxID=1896769 RepID=A0A1B0THY8_9FLOR|nr:anthranilate synthase component II [Campylaephora sungminbooi]AKU47333.1 anthranilate synthase component II [Campylaephora sungminbooi]ALN11780.1 anthranilate synthase component II [Campylaephora sungminbooi]